METLRISRVVGFGSKPPQDFDQSPLTLGTASSASIRFDAAFDKGVAPQHARMEWNGEAWYLLDGGSPEGTWVDGRRLTEAYAIGGELELSLGQNGPKVRVEPLASTPTSNQPPAGKVPVPQTAVSPPPAPSSPATPKSGGLPMGIIAGGVGGVIVLALIIWAIVENGEEKRPSFVDVLNNPTELNMPDQPPAQVVAAQEEDVVAAESAVAEPEPSSQPETKPTSQAQDVVIPEELQEVVAEMKKSAWQQALREFWNATQTRSPYAQAVLAHEDSWLAKQYPWMATVNESGGVSTGRGMDFPGVFVPETIYPDAEWLGLPLAMPDVSSAVGTAVAENAPSVDGSQVAGIASLANAQAPGRRLPSKMKLQNQLRSYAASGPASRDAGEPQAYAFFVGINRFEDPDANLVGCRNDVGAQAKVLSSQGIFQPENLKLMTDARKGTDDYPSKKNVVAALKTLVETAAPGDIIYMGFSTHGGFSQEKQDSFLLMADMEYLYGQELMGILALAQAKNIVITMDACHTGGMPGMGGNQYAAGSKALTPLPESFYEMLGSSRGHVVIRACRADQTTPDIRTLGHGILTTVIVTGLTGDADANGDGIVTLSELRIYVTTAIPRISRRVNELRGNSEGDPLEPTFTSGSFGEAGDLPLTVVKPRNPES